MDSKWRDNPPTAEERLSEAKAWVNHPDGDSNERLWQSVWRLIQAVELLIQSEGEKK